MTENTMVLRQGDVGLVQVLTLPNEAVDATPAQGDVILAYGEATGHAHRIVERQKVRIWNAQAERFLQVLETTMLMHEEHSSVSLTPGIYRLPQQVEYTPTELQRVAD